jgi:hypothetical protein
LHEALSDLMILVWHGPSGQAARDAASRDLARLERELAEQDARLPDDGEVLVAIACVEVDETAGVADSSGRATLRDLLGRVLAAADERPLARREIDSERTVDSSGGS